MSDDKDASPHGRRPAAVSVFRPGQAPGGQPVTFDLATGREIFSAPLPSVLISPAKVWESLGAVQLNAARLVGNGLFPNVTDNPVTATFDMLRTRILHALAERGWRRIAVTSPTHGCGKSFVAVNLALSLARRPDSRTVLIDLDLRRPQLAALLGVSDVAPLADVLSGDQPLEGHLRRVDRRLALALNGAPVDDPAALLHDANTAAALNAVIEHLDPEVVIYDLPPALVSDDVLALAPQIDAVLVVTDGTRTSPADIRATEAMFEGRLPLLGVVLNRSQDRKVGRYRYGRD